MSTVENDSRPDAWWAGYLSGAIESHLSGIADHDRLAEVLAEHSAWCAARKARIAAFTGVAS